MTHISLFGLWKGDDNCEENTDFSDLNVMAISGGGWQVVCLQNICWAERIFSKAPTFWAERIGKKCAGLRTILFINYEINMQGGNFSKINKQAGSNKS